MFAHIPFSLSLIGLLAVVDIGNAQLTGHVGPLTSFQTKAQRKICDITDSVYGAVADGVTDIGPALNTAWVDCAGSGGLVYIPEDPNNGTYALATCLTLKHCASCAIQLDGVITCATDDCGNMIVIRDGNDFEFFSGNSRGAYQGYGYKLLQEGNYGPRFVRFQSMVNFSVHGFAVVDSASYYFVFDSCFNGEIYNLLIRGISIGMTDAIDVWGDNIWVHDVEVTNGDECVCVKSPSTNMLIESIYCNLSGGMSIGSLGTGTTVENIRYNRLYMNRADAAYIKTHNGNGTVQNVWWDTVIVHGGPYPLAVNEAWGPDRGSIGVQISNLIFNNWHGRGATNSRPVIDADVPCYDITVENVALWTEEGDEVEWSCQNAYGSGACLQSATATTNLITYTTVSTVGKPYYATSYMSHDIPTAYPSNSPFTIPPMPTSFYPGATLFDCCRRSLIRCKFSKEE